MIFQVDTDIVGFPPFARTLEEINSYLFILDRHAQMDIPTLKAWFNENEGGVHSYAYGKYSIRVFVKFDSKNYLNV